MSAVAGRAAVVTGANAGIGFETARGLAAEGAQVAMVCRDEKRGAAARQAIIAATGNEGVSLFLADLGVLADVRRVAAEIAAAMPAIAVLIHNAGTAQARRAVTADGLEMTFAVNHLGPFLLTHLLLEQVKAAAPSRIITVASAAHRRGRIDFGDLQHTRRYGVLRAYAASKLANILFTRELARRLKGTGVVANCVHPGTVNTSIWQVNWIARTLAPLVGGLLRTPAEGAATVLFAAMDPAAADVSGVYFADNAPTPSHREHHDPQHDRLRCRCDRFAPRQDCPRVSFGEFTLS